MGMIKIYGVYDVEHREYYEDDNTDPTTAERLLIVGANLDFLRGMANDFFATDEQIRCHRGMRLFFFADTMKSNTWFNNGGGCMASGHLEIRELPTAFKTQ